MSFDVNMNIKLLITFSDTGCVHGEGYSLNTNVVEGTIERHKSLLDSRETDKTMGSLAHVVEQA